MTTILILFVVGVLLLGLEIILPGAILGIAGALAMLAGVVVAFVEFGAQGGGIAILVALLVIGLVLGLEFIWLPRSRFMRAFTVKGAVDGTSQPPIAEAAEVIGRTATAETTLAPSGYVVVDGRRYEAFSRSGLVPAGTALRVVAVDTFRLIVTRP